MRPNDFNHLTPAEFIYAWLGWMELQQAGMRQAWERERWAVWVLTSIQLDRKDRQSMTRMFPLPWESPPAHTEIELTMEERQERVNRILNLKKDET